MCAVQQGYQMNERMNELCGQHIKGEGIAGTVGNDFNLDDEARSASCCSS
jgi:hypothetical protein